MGGLELTPQLFALIGPLVEGRSGLHYGEKDRDLLADKIAAQAADAGFDSMLDYYYHLRYDAGGHAALDALVDALVVHETYFFREAEPVRVLVDRFIAPAVAAGSRPRVWCAACSTGEEPLTLAMLLDDRGLLGRVDVVASDVSRRALSHARAGSFGRRSLRALPPGVAGRWLDVTDAGATIRPGLRESVRWERINLVDADAVGALGIFDAILCRNVLIYFSDETTRQVVARLARALRRGGHLLVGVSESLLRFGTTLACEEHGGVFFYVKGPT